MQAFLLKMGMRVANSPRLLVACIFINWIVCSEAFGLLEHHGPITSLWWGIVSGTTTGYGDYAPRTTPARLIGAWLLVSSVVLVAVGTAQLSSKLIVDRNVFTDEEQEELKGNLRECVALLEHLTSIAHDIERDMYERAYRDRHVLHRERVYPESNDEGDGRLSRARRALSVARRGDHPKDGRGPGGSGGPGDGHGEGLRPAPDQALGDGSVRGEGEST